MKIVSLILARGGSKGIPKKNIKLLAGRPLISYSINESLKSNVNETWVSSDSEEILDISKKYGAKTIKRPDNLSTDLCKSDLALLHFAENINFDILVFLQPTSPLISYNDINEGLLKMNNYDSIFTAYKKHWIPEWSSKLEPLGWNIHNRPMRQEVDYTYVENGAMYITSRSNLLKNKLRYGNKIGVQEMPSDRSLQIDTIEDFELIENIIYSR